MKDFDFLSSSPSIYLLKEKRGKNKLGGIFSILFGLIMLALTLYYLFSYFFGLEYNLTYYRDIFITSTTFVQKKLIKPKSFFLYIIGNPNNAKIQPILQLDKTGIVLIEKCDKNSDYENFCFDLSLFSIEGEIPNQKLWLSCIENCTYPNGTPAKINIEIHISNLKLDHSKDNPFEELKEGAIKFPLDLSITNNERYMCSFVYTPILYNSSEILNTKIKTYFNSYLTTIKENIKYGKTQNFASFSLEINFDYDIYIREYRTLLDTLAKIGGLLTPFKLIFEVLIMLYSDFEINSEITKKVFSKINNYNYKPINNIPIENNKHNTNFKEINEDKIDRKKFNINKVEQFFCGCFNFNCFNCSKRRRTMRILNSCSDLVQTYLSAENIIFNMILFESFYKDNPIKYNINPYLNKINIEIEDKYIFGEEENQKEKDGKKNDENNEFDQELIPY